MHRRSLEPRHRRRLAVAGASIVLIWLAVIAALARVGAPGLAAWLGALLIVVSASCALLASGLLLRPIVVDLDRAASLAVAALVLCGLAGSAALIAAALPGDPAGTGFYGFAGAAIIALFGPLSADVTAFAVPDPALHRRQAGAALAVVTALLVGLAAAVFAIARGEGSTALFATVTVAAFYAAAIIGLGAVVRLIRATP